MALASERLEFRLAPEDKRDMERAAALEGVKLGEFVRRVARQAARESIELHHTTFMDAHSWDVFSAAVQRPGEPVEGLRRLFEFESVLGR